MFHDKHAQQGKVGIFIFVLTSLCGVGLLMLIFWGVFQSYLIPTFSNIATNSTMLNATESASVVSNIQGVGNFVKLGLVALFFIIIIFGIAAAFRKEPSEETL
jgi:hypothetical protein